MFKLDARDFLFFKFYIPICFILFIFLIFKIWFFENFRILSIRFHVVYTMPKFFDLDANFGN